MDDKHNNFSVSIVSHQKCFTLNGDLCCPRCFDNANHGVSTAGAYDLSASQKPTSKCSKRIETTATFLPSVSQDWDSGKRLADLLGRSSPQTLWKRDARRSSSLEILRDICGSAQCGRHLPTLTQSLNQFILYLMCCRHS